MQKTCARLWGAYRNCRSMKALCKKRNKLPRGRNARLTDYRSRNKTAYYLPSIFSCPKASYRALGELCPEDVILLTGACHTTVLFGLSVCAIPSHKAQEI